ncbi:MAG: hypothetical protein NZ483_04565 [Verrucomicrobiae bacterium]|nr:hypothetical protein [Verrucomicrobiae bacterium]
MSEWMILTLLVLAGLILIAMDFYLPGFVLGSIGSVLLLVSLGICWKNHGWRATLVLGAVELVAAIAAGYFSIRYVPQTRLGKKMILSNAHTAKHAPPLDSQSLVGHKGVAHTVLRPTGVAIIDGKRVDVRAESGMIEAGSMVEVVGIHENQIIVRKT